MEVKLPTSLGPENPFVLTISTPEELIRKRPSSAPCENNSLILLVGILPSYQVHLQTIMTTMIVASDQRQKRMRAEEDHDNGQVARSARGGPAASTKITTTPLQALKTKLGSRLETAAALLVSQPTELQDLLIPLLTAMLSLRTTIQQRVETLKKHSKPMVDPKTKKPTKQLGDSEKNLPYISSALRQKCPLKPSDTLKDDPDMKELMDTVASDWELFAKIKMAEHDVKIKQLEIKKRQEQLQVLFFNIAHTWAAGLVIEQEFMIGIPADGQLDSDLLAKKVTFDALKGDEYLSVARALWYQDVHSMLVHFKKVHSYDDAGIDTMTRDEDEAFAEPLKKQLAKDVISITVGIWNSEVAKDKTRLINAAIREKLRPLKIAQATADVRAALDSEGHNSQEQNLLDTVRKTAREETSKQMQRYTKSQRKNYLGDAGIHASTPRKSGQNTSSTSSKSKKQQKQQQSQKQKGTSILKKGKAVKFSPAAKDPSKKGTKSRANRDGAKGGKQKPSAARR